MAFVGAPAGGDPMSWKNQWLNGYDGTEGSGDPPWMKVNRETGYTPTVPDTHVAYVPYQSRSSYIPPTSSQYVSNLERYKWESSKVNLFMMAISFGFVVYSITLLSIKWFSPDVYAKDIVSVLVLGILMCLFNVMNIGVSYYRYVKQDDSFEMMAITGFVFVGSLAGSLAMCIFAGIAHQYKHAEIGFLLNMWSTIVMCVVSVCVGCVLDK